MGHTGPLFMLSSGHTVQVITNILDLESRVNVWFCPKILLSSLNLDFLMLRFDVSLLDFLFAHLDTTTQR